MPVRSVAGRLLLSAPLALAVWVVFRAPLGGAVRGVTVAALRAVGERAHVSPASDRVAIAVQPAREGAPRTRIFGCSLMRWHVNLVALPILAASFGTIGARGRLLLCLLGVPLVLVLDGCSVALHLLLGAARLRGEPWLGATLDRNLDYGIAVYGAKLIPVAVWGGLYLGLAAARGRVRRTSMARRVS
ncbi:MAG TPA: hypothetical protein VKA21_17020 [Candidatus Binatia bacterium]|nr:hypothetical protein [Candidatus Binatia bacterium]